MFHWLSDKPLLNQGHRKGLETFVQNCANEIRRLVPVDYWDHCSGKCSPTDIPSHGLSPAELSVSDLWRYGPSWLHEDLSITLLPPDIPKACTKELKSSKCILLDYANRHQSCEHYYRLSKEQFYPQDILGHHLCFEVCIPLER